MTPELFFKLAHFEVITSIPLSRQQSSILIQWGGRLIMRSKSSPTHPLSNRKFATMVGQYFVYYINRLIGSELPLMGVFILRWLERFVGVLERLHYLYVTYICIFTLMQIKLPVCNSSNNFSWKKIIISHKRL